jgi:predicted O-linked N-acetylglucosamine transferase (SPINDLY family)
MSVSSYEEAVRLASAGKFAEAEKICHALLAKTPNDYLTLYLSASIKLLTMCYEECRALCTRLLAINDKNADVCNMMAAISADCDGDNEETEKWLRRGLECDPNHTKLLVNLANLRLRKQDIDEARTLYQRVLDMTDGKDANALNGIGMIQAHLAQFDDAIKTYRYAYQLAPDDRQILTNLISTLYTVNRPEEAIELAAPVAAYEHPGLAAVPAFACAKSHCLWDVADKLLPVAVHELSERIKNYHVFMLPNMALLSAYEVTNEQLLTVHRKAGESITRLRTQAPFDDYPEAFVPGKRIRLAYISPDLKSHVVSHFFRGLVNHRDRGRFELFLYSNLDEGSEDEVTELYRQNADHFINVSGMKDLELAERIRADGIQILVEMSGYTSGSRLPALVYRPAPVQIGYLGYPFSYGLEEFDFHISDPWIDGPDNDSYFVEKTIRMPQSFLSFGELYEQNIDPIAPRLKNGFITFGSLNNTYKLNRKTVELWARILHRVPGSRMYLNHPNYKLQATQDAIYAEFAKHGIERDRISIITAKHPEGAHLRYYNDMDIMLDSMPLTGGTTTAETLWMGVPVITKVGDAHPQRMSYSMIKNVGINLDDCIAFSEDEYVERAVALAENHERLDELRQTIPVAIRSSIMCDPVRFAAQMESVLIDAWNLKFPEMPIESLITGQAYSPLPAGNTQIVVHDALRDMHAYILREQHGWFEPECAFLERNATQFRQFWDFSADPGMFAVPVAVAQQAGNGGSTLAVRTPGLATVLLDQSLTHHQLHNLNVARQPSDETPPPDLVRFSLDLNDGKGSLIAPWLERMESSAPLVLVSLRNPDGEDLSAVQLLAARGYQAYRLLPGYNLLVPHQAGAALEPSDINLFFCKSERAQALEVQGLLCRELVEIENMPLPDATLWVDLLENLPYATAHLPSWRQQPGTGQWGDMYLLALNLYAGARDATLSPAQRFARIRMVESMFALLLQSEATAPRLLTGIRLMADSGKRQTAVQWAGVLINGLAQSSGAILNEPFLAPEVRWEQSPITGDETEWVRTAAIVASEHLHSFSSWFTEAESYLVWKGLTNNPLVSEEAQRMVNLIEHRAAVAGGPSLVGM